MPTSLRGPRDGDLHPFLEQEPVADAGQRIVECVVRQFALQAAPLGDIPKRHHHDPAR